jgi:hypothetical protein
MKSVSKTFESNPASSTAWYQKRPALYRRDHVLKVGAGSRVLLDRLD